MRLGFESRTQKYFFLVACFWMEKSLEQLVEQWAGGADKEAFKSWLDLLKGPPFHISNIKILIKLANGPFWGELLDQVCDFSPTLATDLYDWNQTRSKRNISQCLLFFELTSPDVRNLHFKWRQPSRLVGTRGRDWPYQSDARWKSISQETIENHFRDQ
jgi:hypothetical protein